MIDVSFSGLTAQVENLTREVTKLRGSCKLDAHGSKSPHDDPEGDNHEGEKRSKRVRSNLGVSNYIGESSQLQQRNQEVYQEKRLSDPPIDKNWEV
uniref:Uncharacterized protein n=1 Tax=Tanacetum cinerariifolium TaxID=118510 RepID=A0A699GMM0_TANCI|nr:hypothetical protein [Tanacetum cinerariifolium]